jgi:hypothetical protein
LVWSLLRGQNRCNHSAVETTVPVPMNQIPESADAALRANQLICIALLAGQFLMGVTVAVVHSVGAIPEPVLAVAETDLFAPIGIGIGAISVPMAYGLRKVIWNRGAAGDAAAVVQSFLAGNLLFHAMLEGASLLNLTFWLITVEAVPYVPVAAVLFVIGLTAIPRRGRLP